MTENKLILLNKLSRCFEMNSNDWDVVRMTAARRLLIIGGSDAGISAGLQAKSLDPELEVRLLLADEFPNLSICGLPYAIGGEVTQWQSLAHRQLSDLEATGIIFEMSTIADKIDPIKQQVFPTTTRGRRRVFDYDELIVATGARPRLAELTNLDLSQLAQPHSRVHVLHTMADYFGLAHQLQNLSLTRVAIVGAGYIGLEMAEALARRNLQVTIFQRGTEVLSTVTADFGQLVHQQLLEHQIEVVTHTTVRRVDEHIDGVRLETVDENAVSSVSTQRRVFDLVLIVVGVEPNSELLKNAGATIGQAGAVKVDEYMQTTLPHVFAAGDLVETRHHLLGMTYLPLGTTAHKQGRVAGTNAAGFQRTFKGVVGTQVVKIFNSVIARTGLLPEQARHAGFEPLVITTDADDHKAYLPGAQPIKIQIVGDRVTGRLLGATLFGRYGSEVAKRNDIFAVAIAQNLTVAEISDLDLSYSPPVGSPWDAIQIATQNWERAQRIQSSHHD